MIALDQRSRTTLRQTPSILRILLYAILLISGLVSVTQVGEYGPIPVSTLLDIWMIAWFMVTLAHGAVRRPAILIGLFVYLAIVTMIVLLRSSPFADFLLAYRWVLYLIFMVAAVRKSWGPVKPLIRVTWIILLLALLKAALTVYLLGAGQRPGLFTENNFELALFGGLLIVLYPHMGRNRSLAIFAFGLLVLLGGSRSGAIAFLIVAAYGVLTARVRDQFTRYLRLLLIPLFALVPVFIFMERAQQSLFTIDRLNFFEVFLHEVTDWEAITWLIGSVPITPLSPEACYRLQYYQSLFASAGDGTCYSVILHAFLMRVIVDAGVLGLVVSIVVPWISLRDSGQGKLSAIALLGVAISNGLSVSGLNNPYVALPIVIAILVAGTVEAEDPHQARDHASQSASTPATLARNTIDRMQT